ncbi:MAG TPA: Rpn family recombination-promoting nuclease/putative transposase [Thermoanaerobaculia bacterium]|jgi:predicted transposase/invertase (TIGR01784 family)
MRPVFADPKTDFIFKRIFGSEPHKHLLIQLLNTLLELEGDRRIRDLTYLPAEQMVPLPEMKLSIVDVKCVDQRGTEYVVEMQLFNVQGFEERVVYNASKAFVMQLRSSEDYPHLADVVGVTICDFELWPELGGSSVPMLSRWRMQEQHTGANGLGQVQYVFLELRKYEGGPHPRSFLDKWTFFFREAENLQVIPPELDEAPFREALEVARMAGMTDAEYEAYERAKMAEQDARGALEKAKEEGEARGRTRELRLRLAELCEVLGIEVTDEHQEVLTTGNLARLERLWDRIREERRWPREF